MTERRTRRKWSDEEKNRIVAQTKVSGVSVPQVAHRYDVSANLIFKWVRDPRYCTDVDIEPEALSFLPMLSFPAIFAPLEINAPIAPNAKNLLYNLDLAIFFSLGSFIAGELDITN